MANEIGSTLVNSLTNSSFDIGNMSKVLAEADVATKRATLERNSEKVNTELGGLKYLETNLNAFQTYVTDLTSPDLFRQKTASSSNESIVSATATSEAVSGSYQIEARQLAQTNTIVFAQTFASSESLIASSGNFEFTVNGQTQTIALDANNGTLDGLQQYINGGDYGVNAAVINDGAGYRMMLTSKTPGAAGEITFAATNAAGLPNGGDAASYVVTSAAQDAVMELNGLEISSSTNTFDDVVDGMEFQLNSASVGIVNTVSVNQKTDTVEDTIRSFVDVYNQLQTILDELGKYDASSLTEDELATGEYEFYGDLAGSSVLRTVRDQVKESMSGAIDELDAGFNALVFAGLSFDREGVLNIDESTFQSALNDNLSSVASLFSKGASSDSGLVSFIGASEKTETGNYTIDVTQAATKAQWTFAPQAGGTFDISVDGSTSVTLNAPVDTGNLDSYALSIMNTINNNSEIASAGGKVSAYVDASNQIVLQSDRYGVNSSISMNLANVGDPALETGVNVDGTIQTESGGVLSLGAYADVEDGRKINISDFAIADDGDTSMRGLSFEVTGNPGVSVAFGFAQGFASRIQETINDFFTNETGLISQRLESLYTKNDEFEERSKEIDVRYEKMELKYRLQFSMLQSIMSSAQSTRDQLTAQFMSSDN